MDKRWRRVPDGKPQTCFSGHGPTEPSLTAGIDVQAADVEKTVAKASRFAIILGAASIMRGRSSMVERQPSKLAVEGSSPFARLIRRGRVSVAIE